MPKIYSFYNQFDINTYTGELNSSSFTWGSIVSSDKQNYKVDIFSEELVSFMKDSLYQENKIILPDNMYYEKYKCFISYLLEEKYWYANNLVTMHFNITVNSSERFLFDYNRNANEEKNIIVVDIGFYYNNDLINVDSLTICDININTFRAYLQKKRDSIIRKIHIEKLNYIPEFKTLCLSGLSSGIITHEVFGHLFEQDNYDQIKRYSEIKIPRFINVIDNPEMMLCGYCLFDEEGNYIKPMNIIKNGEICNLVSSNYWGDRKQYSDNSRSRIGYGGRELLPRVTNTVLIPSNTAYMGNKNEILFVDTVNTARLHRGILSFRIDSAEIELNGKLYRLGKLILKLSAIEFIENIIAVGGKSKAASNSKGCIKKGQSRLGVGFSAPQIYISVEACKSMNISYS